MSSSGETVTSVSSSSPAMHRKEKRHKPQLRDFTEPLPPPQIPAKGTLKHHVLPGYILWCRNYWVTLYNKCINLQMVFVSCLHFWASGSMWPQQLIEQLYKKYKFLIIQIFGLLLIYSLMLCFGNIKYILLYPYTTQFLNYTISLHLKYHFWWYIAFTL